DVDIPTGNARLTRAPLNRISVTLVLVLAIAGPPVYAFGQQAFSLEGHGDTVFALAISADGQTLASSSLDRTAILWDLSNRQPRVTLPGHQSPVSSVALAPDGKTAASGGADNMARIWSCSSGQEIHQLKGHALPVYCLAFSPDGKTLASASADGTVRLWDPA